MTPTTNISIPAAIELLIVFALFCAVVFNSSAIGEKIAGWLQ